MATQWVLGKISDALQPTIAGATASAGTLAGGAMNTIGSSINGVGESINTNIRYYGDGAKDYGNSIMDWTAAPASRAQTASNPLGLSGSTGGGKAKVTGPSVYRAPAAKKTVKVTPAQKGIESPATKRVTSSSTTKPKPKVEPVKKTSSLKAGSASGRAPVPPKSASSVASKPSLTKGGTSPVKSMSTSTSTPMGAVKAKASTKPITTTPAAKKAAMNPLGLTF